VGHILVQLNIFRYFVFVG